MRDPLPAPEDRAHLTAPVRVIGIGRLDRGDDAAGRLVARRLAAHPDGARVMCECDGAMTDLLDAWEGAAAVIVVDAVQSGAPLGTLLRLEATHDPLPFAPEASSHGLGLAMAVELARALERLPARLIVHAIEGGRFEIGAPLTPAVETNLAALAQRVADEARALMAEAGHGGSAGAIARRPGHERRRGGE